MPSKRILIGLAGVALIVVAKALGAVFKRPDTHYDC